MSNSTKIYKIKLHTSKIFYTIIDGFIRLGEFLALIIFNFNILLDEALIKVITKMRQTIINIPPILMGARANFYSRISFLLIDMKVRSGATISAIWKFFITIRGDFEMYAKHIFKLLFKLVISMNMAGIADFAAKNYRRVFGWDRNLTVDPPVDYYIGDWDSPTIRLSNLDIAE